MNVKRRNENICKTSLINKLNNNKAMLLSKFNLKNIDAGIVTVPDESLFALPEKVLQFGTGVLLRGLPDYFIDKANRNGIFNGRIVVVKSTDSGDSAAFDKQDGLYTCLLYTSPSPRDGLLSRMPSSA